MLREPLIGDMWPLCDDVFGAGKIILGTICTVLAVAVVIGKLLFGVSQSVLKDYEFSAGIM